MKEKDTNKMNIFNELKEKLRISPVENIIKSMGYHSLDKGQNAIDLFIEKRSINHWLESGFYDLLYTAEQFIVKLSVILKVNPDYIKDKIILHKQTILELRKLKNAYIFVNTNFKRTTQPILALAFMEQKRLILPAKDKLIFKSTEKKLNIISSFIKSHYKYNNGKLDMWGKIDSYIYHQNINKKYTFNIKGNLIENAPDIFENRATFGV